MIWKRQNQFGCAGHIVEAFCFVNEVYRICWSLSTPFPLININQQKAKKRASTPGWNARVHHFPHSNEFLSTAPRSARPRAARACLRGFCAVLGAGDVHLWRRAKDGPGARRFGGEGKVKVWRRTQEVTRNKGHRY